MSSAQLQKNNHEWGRYTFSFTNARAPLCACARTQYEMVLSTKESKQKMYSKIGKWVTLGALQHRGDRAQVDCVATELDAANVFLFWRVVQVSAARQHEFGCLWSLITTVAKTRRFELWNSVRKNMYSLLCGVIIKSSPFTHLIVYDIIMVKKIAWHKFWLMTALNCILFSGNGGFT